MLQPALQLSNALSSDLAFLLASLLHAPADHQSQIVRVALLCPPEAKYVSHCISDLQLQGIDLIQLLCSIAELQRAWLRLKANCALKPVKLLLQLLKALGVAGC